MRTAFERAGDVRSVDLLAAFATLWRERATGVLTFSRLEHRVRFEILEGAVLGVSSSDPAFDTAEVLVRAGKLDAAVLEGRRLPAGRDRARAARELGLLTERDWRWGEKIRAVEILSDLIGWLEGTYKLDPFDRPEEGGFRVGIERLLLELFLRSRDRAFIHQSLGAVDAPLQRAANFDEEFPALGLTSEALAVVEAIDGRTTAAEIPRRVAPDPFSVEKLLAALTTLGLVHPEYAAEAPPTAKPTIPGAALPAPPPELQPPRSPAVPVAAVEAAEAPGLSGTEPGMEVSPPGDEAPREGAAGAGPERELSLAPSPEPSHPEPLVTSWEQEPAGPMDQPLELPEPPAFLPSRRSSLTPIWLLVLLAIAVGALLLFRARERGAGAAGVPSVAPTAIATSAALVVTEALPTVAPPTPVPPTVAPPTPVPPTEVPPTPVPPTEVPPTPVPPTEVPPTPVPPTEVPPTPVPRTATPRPLPTKPPPTAEGPEQPPIGRRQWLARAGRDRRLLLRNRRTRYTIQLELVCELPSLDEAWRYDRRGAMWLLTASHRGRECFRVFWGRYATLDEARAAKSAVPRFFFTPTNEPVVVSTRGALLR